MLTLYSLAAAIFAFVFNAVVLPSSKPLAKNKQTTEEKSTAYAMSFKSDRLLFSYISLIHTFEMDRTIKLIPHSQNLLSETGLNPIQRYMFRSEHCSFDT